MKDTGDDRGIGDGLRAGSEDSGDCAHDGRGRYRLDEGDINIMDCCL